MRVILYEKEEEKNNAEDNNNEKKFRKIFNLKCVLIIFHAQKNKNLTKWQS